MSDPVHISVCVDEAMQELLNPRYRVSSKRGCLVIEQQGRTLYSIPWFELDTERKLLFWLCVLAEKTWFRGLIVERTLRAIIRHKGFDQ